MEPVARRLLGEAIGEPNKHLSTKSELRWGKNGSISVDLTKGVWNDHEEQTGGGVLELVKAYQGFEKGEAVAWLIENGFLEDRPAADGSARFEPEGVKVPGGFPDFMTPKPAAFFEYQDDEGRLAYQVLKFPKTAPRRYMQRRPHPKGGWIWGLQEGSYGCNKSKDWWKAKQDKKYEAVETFPDAPRYLYQLAKVRGARETGGMVFLMEGEKDADTVTAWGFIGTTNVGGAQYWQDAFNDEFAGCDVVICNDNDDTGRNRAQVRAAALVGVAANVYLLDIADYWSECQTKDDISDWRDRAGGTSEKFREIVKGLRPWRPTPPRSQFGGLSWHDLDTPGADVEYLVNGMLTLNDRSMVAGPSGSGKSFLTIHLGMCVARGQEFLGRSVMQGGVIYQAGEGARGIKKRIKAYRAHFRVPDNEDVPFVLLPAKVDLFSKDGDTGKLIEEINAWKVTLSHPLRLFVIDTFSRATAGADENSGKDVSQIMDNVDRISRECGVHVMIVHHMNADGRKLRGHTSLYADVDQVLTITNDDETKIRTLSLTKQKDDDDGVKIQFSLAQVKVGWNAEAEQDVTSCVVLSVTEKERLKKEQEREGFTVNPSERRFLVNFFEAMDKHGKLVVDDRDGPKAANGKTVVEYSDYADLAVSKMVEEEDQKKARERVRKSFQRVTDALVKYGIVKLERPFIWWTGKPVRGFPRTFPRRDTDFFRQTEMPIRENDAELEAFFANEAEVPF